MSDTHTPGPWAVSDGREVHPGAGTDAVVIVDQEGSWIAETHTTTSNANPALDTVDLPAEANACLMAAAPDMLAALEKARIRCTGCEAMRVIDAAIAKAKGEE